MAVSAASVIPGFAYDKISLSSCEVENKHSIVIEGTAQAGETAEGEVPDDGYYYSGIFNTENPAPYKTPTTKSSEESNFKSFFRIITYEIPQ